MINWFKSLFKKNPQACNDNRMYQDIEGKFIYFNPSPYFLIGTTKGVYTFSEASDPNDWTAESDYIYWDKE